MLINESVTETQPMKASPKPSRRLRLGLLVFFGMDLGVIIAFLITREAWIYVAALAAIPVILWVANYPFTGVILWLLLMPFISIFPNSSTAYWVIYRGLTPAILILAVLYRAMAVREHPQARLGPPELAMGVLALIVPASALLTQSSPGPVLILYADDILLPFCMYLAIRLQAPREREFYQLQWVALFIVFSQGLIGFLSWVRPQLLPHAWLTLQGFRTTGSLTDADLYSALLIFGAVLLIQGGIQRKPGIVRLMFFAASGVSAIFVFMSLERAAWIGAILVVFGLVLLFRRVMLRLIIIGSILMGVLGTGILSAHVGLSLTRLNDPVPVYDRIVVFDALFQMIEIHPILGWGYQTLDQNIQSFYRTNGEAVILRGLITSHNSYLTILVELGMVGFVLYMFPVIWWLLLSIRVWRRMPKEGLWSRSLLAVLWLSMLFDFTISNFIDIRWFPIGITHWWLVLGLIANMVYPYLKDRQVPVPASTLLPEGQA